MHNEFAFIFVQQGLVCAFRKERFKPSWPVQSGMKGVGSNVTLGGYAEAASMYAAGVEKSPYFVNTGGRAVNFEWGFVLRWPFYGANPRHFNNPPNVDVDYSPGTLR